MIRARREEDLERVVAALRAVYRSDGYPTNWPNDPARWVAGRGALGAWICERDNTLVGHVALTAADPDKAWPQWGEALSLPAESLAVVSRFFVTLGHRNEGIGGRLMSRVQREASRRGLRLVLDVSEHNQAAISFYSSRGWRQVGRARLPPGDEGRVVRLVLFVSPD